MRAVSNLSRGYHGGDHHQSPVRSWARWDGTLRDWLAAGRRRRTDRSAERRRGRALAPHISSGPDRGDTDWIGNVNYR